MIFARDSEGIFSSFIYLKKRGIFSIDFISSIISPFFESLNISFNGLTFISVINFNYLFKCLFIILLKIIIKILLIFY